MAAIWQGLQFKQAEVHGMSQRGGAVVSHLRVSDSTIHSDLVPKGTAHIILAVEPVDERWIPAQCIQQWMVPHRRGRRVGENKYHPIPEVPVAVERPG